MISNAAVINRALRQHVAPVLRNADFPVVDARNGWRWLEQSIWIFNLRSVGSYFSEVSGWPPSTLSASLSVYYSFIPSRAPLKRDAKMRPRPPKHLGHFRSVLACHIDQSSQVSHLSNAAERKRKDLFWVEPDGSNANEVAVDIARSLVEEGLPWFDRLSDLNNALAEAEAMRDCFVKFDLAAHLAREIGDAATAKRYAELAEAEQIRIRERTRGKVRLR